MVAASPKAHRTPFETGLSLGRCEPARVISLSNTGKSQEGRYGLCSPTKQDVSEVCAARVRCAGRMCVSDADRCLRSGAVRRRDRPGRRSAAGCPAGRDGHAHQHGHVRQARASERRRGPVHVPELATGNVQHRLHADRVQGAASDRPQRVGRQPDPHRSHAGDRRNVRDGQRRFRHDAAAVGQGRAQHRADVEGRHHAAAERLPQLPESAEPGAGRNADPVPERRDRHARALAADVGQRHAAEREHDAR